MDNTKKQDLTPELKEIYDRVMNTTAKAAPAAPTTPLTPPTATPAPEMHPAEMHTTVAPTQPVETTPMQPTSQETQNPQMTDSGEQGATQGNEEFLSSAPARPLQDIGVKAFAYTGKKVTATTADAANAAAPPLQAASKKGISKPILIVLVFVFVVVWGVFWAVLLGLLKF